MNNRTDKITNWIEKIPKQFKTATTNDPTYKHHLIKPNSMIAIVGQTGSGKTNSVIEFLHRKDGRFFEIIIYTGSNKDEPLYNFLSKAIDGIQIIDKPEELPMIEDFRDTTIKNQEKLIVFDDSVMSDKKVLKEINKWFMCARKLNFSCIFLAQDYHSIVPFIRRNIQYLFLFKMTDLRDMKNILSKYCTEVNINTLKNMLNYATKEKGNFLCICLVDPIETKFRKNFTEILNPMDYI